MDHTSFGQLRSAEYPSSSPGLTASHAGKRPSLPSLARLEVVARSQIYIRNFFLDVYLTTSLSKLPQFTLPKDELSITINKVRPEYTLSFYLLRTINLKNSSNYLDTQKIIGLQFAFPIGTMWNFGRREVELHFSFLSCPFSPRCMQISFGMTNRHSI